jgi:hypothetical protein
MQTEQAMKSRLDGTFTRLVYSDHGTRILTLIVPADYIPSHENPKRCPILCAAVVQ